MVYEGFIFLIMDAEGIIIREGVKRSIVGIVRLCDITYGSLLYWS